MTTVATFEVKYVQYLDENGSPTQKLPSFAKDTEYMLRLYRSMQRTRAVDAKAVRMQRQGKMGTYPSSLGQEAVSVGMGAAMVPQDVFCPYYRDTGALFERGVTITELLRYWGGDERGSAYAHVPKDLPISVPIATQCLHAAGCAAAIQYRKVPHAAVTSIGEGGTSEGDFYESVNVAGIWGLPLMVMVNNNQWAISVPREKQTKAKTFAQKAIAAGIHCVQVDGNDIIAVHHESLKALKKARADKGPTVIEALTYRLCDHTTADDASRYNSAQAHEDALKKEPLIRLRAYLEGLGVWDESLQNKLDAEIKAEVDQAVAEYQQILPDKGEAMFDDMYANMPESLVEQREEYRGEHD